jgi:hypothetical protein
MVNIYNIIRGIDYTANCQQGHIVDEGYGYAEKDSTIAEFTKYIREVSLWLDKLDHDGLIKKLDWDDVSWMEAEWNLEGKLCEDFCLVVTIEKLGEKAVVVVKVNLVGLLERLKLTWSGERYLTSGNTFKKAKKDTIQEEESITCSTLRLGENLNGRQVALAMVETVKKLKKALAVIRQIESL